MSVVLETSRAGRWLQRLDAIPAWGWLALQAAASWVHWRWAAARLADGSDDPLGVAALVVLAAAVVRLAPALRAQPRPGRLAAALTLCAVSTAAVFVAPPLVGALLAALALAFGLAAFMPAGQPLLPLAGLALLALPLVSSLQFYAGYPLRVVTAELSAWLLRAGGFVAERSGAAMTVDGRLVLVDAPCSGVQMVWMAYFCACAVGAFTAAADRRWLRRLPGVGLIVLAGNTVRNSVLVAWQAHGTVSEMAHQAVGLAALAAVCAAVVVLNGLPSAARSGMRARERPGALTGVVPSCSALRYEPFGRPCGTTGAPSCSALRHEPFGRPCTLMHAGRGRTGSRPLPQATRPGLTPAPDHARAKALCAFALVLCALAPLARPHAAATPPHVASEPPVDWDGHAWRPLAQDAVELRFAARFPGRIARLTDGERVLVWREVAAPTRMLHPAADCYRGLGYRIGQARLERDGSERVWRCFVAERDGRRVRVCERIVDAAGQSFTDASSWYWAAQLGRSVGPWHAYTLARSL
jgi:exosortase/archaeosortase family protein